MSSSKPTRADVEAKLSAAQDSITQRIQTIEGEVRLPRLSAALPGVPEGKPRILLIAAGVGLAAAWLVAHLTRRRPAAGDGYTQDIADDVSRLVEEGYDLDAAVRRAVRRNAPPAPAASPSRGGLFSNLALTAISVGLNSVVRNLFSSDPGEGGGAEGGPGQVD